ncbi:MAG: Fe-S cluster assembly scaffold SufA [Alphaproteobacteria bacterium 16-39-46]|nr:MAG: Fe-S cluster assembly scaffold SufA [Alphaproteobacteria bacterium 16-39-46]OZA44091.1 MAG: Fe-S cluster assembly scaffold SufA [Alphaproteobacteria bacterium 17-39-52]HQS83607.1 iron-sulfur cluster assembly accessory protein [Alphaproteobacteria bacterium]HQS93396.1 iron-sulfur cluster assembly accessory protein [Alphaproteobacteria bacterium]
MTVLTPRPSFLKVDEKAAQKIKELLEKRNKPSLGIRIGVKSRGCSGLSYVLEYADEMLPLDEKINVHGVTIIVDSKAVMFLIGTEMHYEETDLNSGFIFKNPNEKGRCGCGESFHV